MNPLWILGAFLLLGKKKTNTSNSDNPGNTGNPVGTDDPVDRL